MRFGAALSGCIFSQYKKTKNGGKTPIFPVYSAEVQKTRPQPSHLFPESEFYSLALVLCDRGHRTLAGALARVI